MHPVMLMLRLIICIWLELFFHMVSSYGKKHLRDKRSITCHERLLQHWIILPIKNVSIVSNLNFQKIVLLMRFLDWLKSLVGSHVFSPWWCLYINRVDSQSSFNKLDRLSTSDLSLQDITQILKAFEVLLFYFHLLKIPNHNYIQY